MKTFIRLTLLASALALGLHGLHKVSEAAKPAPPPSPPVTYTLTFVGSNLNLAKLNEAGVAVGSTGGDAPRAKVRLADGTLVDLTDHVQAEILGPWVLLDYAFEINTSGQIAGRGWRIEEDGNAHARLFRYSPTTGDNPANIEALRTFELGSSLYVEGMTDEGDVLLHSQEAGAPDGAWVVSGPPGMAVATKLPLAGSAVPLAINSSGQVTGKLDDGTQTRAFRFTQATLTSPATTELFGTISGSLATGSGQSHGEDINDLGIIAGFALQGRPKRGQEDTSPWAVRLTASGTWETVAGGGSSISSGINNSGVTVGTRTGVNGQGFVFLSGKAYALKDLVVNPRADLRLLLPHDITTSGQICGEAVFANPDGSYQWGGGFILTPILP